MARSRQGELPLEVGPTPPPWEVEAQPGGLVYLVRRTGPLSVRTVASFGPTNCPEARATAEWVASLVNATPAQYHLPPPGLLQ